MKLWIAIDVNSVEKYQYEAIDVAIVNSQNLTPIKICFLEIENEIASCDSYTFSGNCVNQPKKDSITEMIFYIGLI